MIELDDLKTEVVGWNETTYITGSCTPGRKEKAEGWTTAIERNDSRTIKHTMKRLACTGISLDIVVVKNVRTLTTKQNPRLHFGFCEQVIERLPYSYTELSMKIDEIRCSCAANFHHPPCFVDHTSEVRKY